MIVLDNLRCITDAGYKRNMTYRELYVALGLDPNRHLPDAGLPIQMVGNVRIDVHSRIPGTNQDAKRVWCVCPHCQKYLTAGKFHQHMKVHPMRLDMPVR